MGLFGRKKEEVHGMIGLDIGANGMKLVELIQFQRRLILSTYGHVSLKDQDINLQQEIDHAEKLGQALRALAEKTKTQQKKVNVSLPEHSVFHAIITIKTPKTADEDIQAAIEKKAKPLLPMKREDMVLDSIVIDKHLLPKKLQNKEKNKNDGVGEDIEKAIKDFAQAEKVDEDQGYVRVLISGSPKKMVEDYVRMVKVAKLELTALETESFALIRSLIGNDKSRIMIVDIGHERTNITISQEGIPFLHRSIAAGGHALTNAISRSIGVDYEQAAQIKEALKDSDIDEIPKHIEDVLAPIIHEIKYSLELYAGQDFHAHNTVEKVILTGGSAKLPFLHKILEDKLAVNVYTGDPWARILKPKAIVPLLDRIGSEYSVAAGLAMKQ